MMKLQTCATILLVTLVVTFVNVDAWGGLFNRFSPEMLSNLGYGHHNGYLGKSGLLQRPLADDYSTGFGNALDEMVEHPCDERKCITSEDCCSGQFCVNSNFAEEGKCVFLYGLKQGEICRRDTDCETGLMCVDVAGGATRSCQPPVTSNKQYSEECVTSGECDTSRGLCCQLQRRHRQTPRKVCSYFKDPLVCIGPVAIDQVKSIVDYTSGEKRIANQGNRLFKRLPFA
ncbi:prohormone-3 isoform X2 [Prorops nasuta]|uniref:prohormone-3 isoform X2 n=1 Tax=Prorops nasuta TaxID=863751 RepID=UPI0034CF4C7F